MGVRVVCGRGGRLGLHVSVVTNDHFVDFVRRLYLLDGRNIAMAVRVIVKNALVHRWLDWGGCAVCASSRDRRAA